MNKRRWVFVTAPFIVFTVYTFLISSYFPDAPEKMRWLVSFFLGFIFLLLIVQKAFKDDNYFIPAMVMVLAANFIMIFSVDINQFDNLESIAPILRLFVERPQLILYSGLVIMAIAPPILWNGSFTCYFSRLDYPADDWQDPDFIRVNKKISYFWAVVFFLCFVSQFVPLLPVQLFAPVAIVMTLGVRGTRRLRDLFIGRLEAGE